MTEKNGIRSAWTGLCSAVILGVLLRLFVFDLYLVEGTSMEPALREGGVILLNRAAFGIRLPIGDGYLLRWNEPAPGDLLVFRDPFDGNRKVKRCSSIESGSNRTEGKRVFLVGDNSGVSVDSRFFGPVPVEKVVGKVILSIER